MECKFVHKIIIMKNKLFTLFLVTFSIFSYGQSINENDYKFLNEIIPRLVSLARHDSVFLYEETLIFKDQKKFFAKNFLENYIYVPLGTNGVLGRVRKKLGFE